MVLINRESPSSKFPLGSALPNFKLLATDGSLIGDSDLKGRVGTLIVFTCNHCPYVKGSDDMMVENLTLAASSGLGVALISSNDPTQYPEDSYEKMQEKHSRLNLPCPYLWDETQDVAKLFDAQCTPECYLFDKDGILVYHGTVNDSPRDPSSVTINYLKNAVTQLASGEPLNPPYTHPFGCSIKWRV